MFFGNKPKTKRIDFTPNLQTLIIGDIHGCFDQIKLLYQQFVSQIAPESKRKIISLGDLVDRGPDSEAVIEWFLSAPRGEERLAVRGNHEIMFDEFIRSPSPQSPWLSVGGMQTLASYSNKRLPENPSQSDVTRTVQSIPKRHVSFCRSLPDIIVLGNVCLVHAAIDPAKSVNAQPLDRLHWGPCIGPNDTNMVRFRDPTINKVVHGHEPHSRQPNLDLPVLNLDTGCYKTGVLTGLVLNQNSVTTIQTGPKKSASESRF